MRRFLQRTLGKHLELWMILVVGAFLRVHAIANTAFTTRAYDIPGHLEYINYLIEHGRIPRAFTGWETHQPPLFYLLAALWGSAKRMMTGAQGIDWPNLQFLSLVFAIVGLGIALWIALLLFPGKRDSTKAILFAGIMAAVPGLVFGATRISNDSLATLLLFAALAALLAWWKSGDSKTWLLLCVFIGLGTLTKVNVTFFGGICGICLLLRPGMAWKQKLILASVMAGVVVLLAGWFVAMRLAQGYYTHLIVPHGWTLNRNLIVVNSPEDFVVFNPWRVLEIPYASPWDDAARRRFVWEYFFKTVLFGEWHFPKFIWLMRFMLLGLLGVTGLAVVGAVRDIRKKGPFRIPLLLTFAGFALAFVFIRIQHPAPCVHDFRLAPTMLVPVAYYACTAAGSLRGAAGIVSRWWIGAFCAACGLFILLLPLTA